MVYETLFVRLKIFIKDKELLSFAKRRILLLCHLNLGKLNGFAQSSTIIQITNKRDIQEMIEDFEINKR